ncbi:MAG: hypothetical protein ACOH2K_17700 [Burkholderiaceae bacterium]
MIFDLDGDGLEITRLNITPPILFDANGDGLLTGTAWAGADDGRELFGDETLLADGSKAAHGFAALRELDSNADGVFDAADAQFNEVRISRDLNQDGVIQAGELKTLLETGVQSIKLDNAATSIQPDCHFIHRQRFRHHASNTDNRSNQLIHN